MKEYGKKPYLANTYNDMIRKITDKQIHDQMVVQQSEMKKPYMNNSYEEMEQYWSKTEDPTITPFDPPPYPELPGGGGGGNCHPNFHIGYTTLTMMLKESQTLFVVNDTARPEDYSWHLRNGGTLKPVKGKSSVIYTAPDHNPQCLMPTIDLFCGGRKADMGIMINITTKANPTVPAYSKNQECVTTCASSQGAIDYAARIMKKYYNCADKYISEEVCCHKANQGYGDCAWGLQLAAALCVECAVLCPPRLVIDLRTQEMKDDGCCPLALK